MIGAIVIRTNSPWLPGGRIEQVHRAFDDLYGIRGADGHLYWKWLTDFSIGGDLFAPL